MLTSLQGIQLIKKWEQCRLKAYKKFVGEPWTIGWGHTGDDVTETTVWTQAQADAQFVKDLLHDEHCVDEHVSVPLTQGEYDALVSLIHNIGCRAFVGSTLLRKLNDSDYNGASAELPRWDHQNHVEVAGLLARRREEQILFEQWMVS